MYLTQLKKDDAIYLGNDIVITIGKRIGKSIQLKLNVPKSMKITKVISESGKMNYHCYKCSHEFYLEEGLDKICPKCGGRDLEPYED